jgi:large subunit ribosomal protein L21
MYAIFEDGARQFMVEEGDVVQVDFREVEVGGRVEFDRVLLFHTGDEARVGQPTVAGARVIAEVLDHPSTKTYIQKFRRRKNYRRFRGHRQYFMEVGIVEITMPGWERPASEESDQSDEGTQESAGEKEAQES